MQSDFVQLRATVESSDFVCEVILRFKSHRLLNWLVVCPLQIFTVPERKVVHPRNDCSCHAVMIMDVAGQEPFWIGDLGIGLLLKKLSRI